MNDTICLNNKHSTTKLLTKEYPKIINNLEDKFESVLFLPEGEDRRGEGGLRTKGYFKKSYEDKPLISIVTVVFNGEEFLEETIQSVINQTYDNVEYIIIDGGSTDGTVDIIKKYEDRIDYWVSEKDSGIYDAMNKGISLFQGQYIWFINAGDLLYNTDILKSIFNINCIADSYYGRTALIKKNNVIAKITNIPNVLSWKSMSRGMVISHQSIIFHRNKVVLYNLNYNVVSDHDWIIQILKNCDSIINTDLTLSRYLLDGFSEANFGICWIERIQIIKNHYSSFTVFFNYLIYFKEKVKKVIKYKFNVK